VALTRTSHLVLGLIRRGHRTGYEMKGMIERTARFFWTASYGQIYPELARLEQAGLIEGRDDESSGRRRTEYALTGEGEAAFRAWMADNDDLVFEFRSEGLLKLLLSRDLGAEAQLAILARFREQAEERRAGMALARPGREIGRRVQDYGMRMHAETVAWCDDLEAAIRAGKLDDGPR
jgi:DNA-binding PadR family transcriptional regulator